MTITCQTINNCWCLDKGHNCYSTIFLLPFTILADCIHFILYLAIYPILCILSPIWFTLLYPLFSDRFHHATNNCDQGCTRFIFTNHCDESDDCNSGFYLYFFVDLMINLEVLVWDIFAALFALILFVVNVALLPLTLIISVVYFAFNAISYTRHPNLFPERMDIQIFFAPDNSNNEYESFYHPSKKVSMCKIIELLPASLLASVIMMALATGTLLLVIFSPLIILLMIIHILASIPLLCCCSNISCAQMIIAPIVILISQIMSSSLHNSDNSYSVDNMYDQIEGWNAPYKPTTSDYMCGRDV